MSSTTTSNENKWVKIIEIISRVELPIVCNSRRHSVPANLLSKKAISYFGRNNLSLCEQQSAMLLTPKFGSEASIYPLTNEDLCNKGIFLKKTLWLPSTIEVKLYLSISRFYNKSY